MRRGLFFSFAPCPPMKHEDIAASRLELPVQPICQDVLAEKYL